MAMWGILTKKENQQISGSCLHVARASNISASCSLKTKAKQLQIPIVFDINI